MQKLNVTSLPPAQFLQLKNGLVKESDFLFVCKMIEFVFHVGLPFPSQLGLGRLMLYAAIFLAGAIGLKKSIFNFLDYIPAHRPMLSAIVLTTSGAAIIIATLQILIVLGPHVT
jgi:hypothetical protein